MKISIKTLIPIILILAGFVTGQDDISVRSLTINGNKHIKTKAIKPLLRLEKGGWFSKPAFDRRLLKMDAITIKNYYLSQGYLAVSVVDSFSIADGKADIYFRIKEGNQYFIRSVQVTGNHLVPTQRILDILQFHTGEPYNSVAANLQLPILEAEHHQYGKLYARVTVQEVIQDSVDLFIKVDEGIDVSIKDYYLEGVEPINPRVVEREIRFKRGTLYQKDLIDKTQRRIKETGVFSLVTLSPIRVAQTDSLVDILIEVRQFKTREWISEGGIYPVEFFEGYDAIPGLGGDIEWRNRSLFNTSTNFSAKLSGHIPFEQDFYYPKISYNMSFSNQWLFGLWRIPTTIGLYYETLKKPDRRNDPNIYRYGFKIENNVKFLNRSFVLSGISWEKYIVPKETTIDEKSATDIEQRSIDLNIHIDKANDPLYPSRGFKLDVNLRQTGGPLLGGSREYFKYDIGVNSYLPLVGKIVFASRLKYGMMLGWKTGYDDIQFDQFYLGGSTTLRGWDTFRFRTRSTENGPVPDGDVIRLLTNWEIRIPLFWRLGMELFFDGGLLTGNVSSIKYTNIQWNQGAGLTLETPLGPIRLDVAHPIDDKGVWKIQLGLHYIF